MNAVERHLARMCGEWLKFRGDQEARLLLWQVPENGIRMVECFVEAQKNESEYSSGDLFLLMKVPFVHGLQYARALKEWLRGSFDASLKDLEREGLPTDWTFDPTATPDTPSGFLNALLSFESKYRDSLGHVCVVLWPTSVAHGGSFLRWLKGFLDLGLPERLRMLLVDNAEYPAFQPLADWADPRVRVQHLPIDGLLVAQEAFAQEAAVGPAAVFRNLTMGIVTLLERGTADQVASKAQDALLFARKQNWLGQEVALLMLQAGALLKESRHAEALKMYQSARAAAERTVEAGHPAGHKMMLQTWFGQAGVHLSEGKNQEAARCYDEAAVIAQQDNNPTLAIEAFRMAAFSLGRAGDLQGAGKRGASAIEIAAALEPTERAVTTLPVAIVDQLRLVDLSRVKQMQRVKRDLQLRLGALREEADRQAEALVQRGASDALERVEAIRHQGAQEAAAKAMAQLSSLIAGGAPVFVALAARGRELLGDAWLVDNDIALPALPPGGSRP